MIIDAFCSMLFGQRPVVQQIPALDQIFTRNDLFRGRARAAWLWAVLGAVVQCLVLLAMLCLLSLFVPRTVVLSGDGFDEYESFSGQEVLRGKEKVVHLKPPSGVISTAWQLRGNCIGVVLGFTYRNFSPLQHDHSALPTLITLLVVFLLARVWIIDHIRELSEEEGLGVARRLRSNLHRQTLRLGPSDIQDTRNQYVLKLFTDDVNSVRIGLGDYLNSLTRLWPEVGLMLVLAISLNWMIAIECIVPIGFCLYLLHRERLNVEVIRRLNSDRAAHELNILGESLRKARLVRAYGMEDFEHHQFDIHLNALTESLHGQNRKGAWNWALRAGALIGVAASVFLLGKKLLPVDIGAGPPLSLPVASTLLVALSCCIPRLIRFHRAKLQLDDSSEAAGRIQRYLVQIPEVGQAIGAKFLQPLTKSLVFESVSYRMPDNRLLFQSLDLKIKAGELVAVVSIDPLEARAFSYLLPRFIEPHDGRVLFDGEDIAWVTLDSLRAESVYVGGADPFFSGSVMENITCGNSDYSAQQVTEAAKQAHAHNFVLKLQDGYETILGEHGERLAPGEAFRLGLARAVLRNPALMVIEEPDVIFDNDTKSLLEDAYQRIFPGRTVVILPSRLSTLRLADWVVVLHRGRVETVGKHANLVKTSEVYRHWEYLRFNEFRQEQE